MAKQGPKSSVRIAALDKREKTEKRDVLHAGNGTPWEDRGATGTAAAFMATCKMALFTPRRLWAEIRRAESGGEATPFVIGCALVGVLAGAINGAAWGAYRHTLTEPGGVRQVVLFAFFGGMIVWAAHFLGSALYHRMLGDANRRRIPVALVKILYGYFLAPVWFALIPFIGPIIAAVWVLTLWYMAGRRRLYVRSGEAVVAFAVTTTAMILALGIGGFVVWWLLEQALSNVI